MNLNHAATRSFAALGTIAATFLVAAPAVAQRPRLLQPRAERGQQEEVIAAAGAPFGVGKLTIMLPRGGTVPTTPGDDFTLAEKNGRALYSTFGQAAPVRGLLREVLDRPPSLTVYFLFKGDAPLDLTLYAPTAIDRHVAPQNDAALHAKLLAEWWREYTVAPRRLAGLISEISPIPLRTGKDDEYPHLVDVYLTSMLSRRLSLAAPEPEQPLLGGAKKSDLTNALGLLAGTEATRAKMEHDIMLGGMSAAESADQPVPQPVQMTALEELPPPGELKIEPIASHVPAECLYVHFGSFNNYQWFRKRLDQWGGDMRTMISARGLNYNMNARLEQQLSLHETPLSALLGPTVIADVALIGDDTFFREGAAIGMLFQARNNLGLASDFNRQRAEALSKEPGCTEKKIEIAGHTVSFLSTPDNRVRSFYAIDGDYHFVTTSRAMVERFFAAGSGKSPLASASDFVLARRTMPLERDDTVFAFLSTEFFSQLASPAYQIEMQRRLRSATEINLVEMARLAAQAEGAPATTLEQLVSGGYLPRSVLQRPDGSRLVLDKDGQVSDSLRGAEGTFMPVPDMSFRGVTRAEAADYSRFAASFQTDVGRMDPLVAAIKQLPSDNDRDRVGIAVRMLPLEPKHYALAMRLLGPADKQRLAPVPSDVLTVEGYVSGTVLSFFQSIIPGGVAQAGPYHLFLGVRNVEAPYDLRNGQFEMRGGLLGSVPFYVGAWPTPGILGLLGLGSPNLPRDAEGYGQTRLMWERQMGPITVAAPRRETLADVTPQIKPIDSQRPAQLWLHIGDVTQSKLTQFSNALGYSRARQITEGNTHFLHSLTTQLGIAPDQAQTVGERLLGGKLISPIGGQFELSKPEGEFPFWISTALKTADPTAGRTTVPADFQSPPLDWFRGLDAELAIDQGKLSLDAEVQMLKHEAKPAIPAAPAAIGGK